MSDPLLIIANYEQVLADYDPKERLEAYYDALLFANETVNLVSRETSKADLKKLSVDSLLPFNYFQTDSMKNYLDIGSGGGFPSIPILLVKKIIQASLFERRSKKANALEEVVAALGLDNTQVYSENFEDYAFDRKYDIITLRLVSLTERLMKNISSLMTDTSVFIYYSTVSIPLEKYKLTHKTYTYQIGSTDRFKSFSIIRKK